MTTGQWILSVIVALIGGGAMGAVITAFVTRYRNRRQPIAYKMEIIEIFKQNPEFISLQAVLMEGDKPKFTADNFSIARITLTNEGNQDIEQFSFGVTLKGTNKAIDIKRETPDRHHEIQVLNPVGLSTPATELDFNLMPFNRGDKYILSVYFTYIDSSSPIELSSSHSTKFVETNTETDSTTFRIPKGIILFIFLLIYFLFNLAKYLLDMFDKFWSDAFNGIMG